MKPTVVVFPGASLMSIKATSRGLRVRCPGCRAVQVFADAGAVGHAAFVHRDGCAVHARIEDAMRRYVREVVRQG